MAYMRFRSGLDRFSMRFRSGLDRFSLYNVAILQVPLSHVEAAAAAACETHGKMMSHRQSILDNETEEYSRLGIFIEHQRCYL